MHLGVRCCGFHCSNAARLAGWLAGWLDGWMDGWTPPPSPRLRALSHPVLSSTPAALLAASVVSLTLLLVLLVYAGTVLDNQEVRDKLSSAEQTFTTDYFVSMGRHFKSSVLDDLPPAYQSLVSVEPEGRGSSGGASPRCTMCLGSAASMFHNPPPVHACLDLSQTQLVTASVRKARGGIHACRQDMRQDLCAGKVA
jgi:hypothetical protein